MTHPWVHMHDVLCIGWGATNSAEGSTDINLLFNIKKKQGVDCWLQVKRSRNTHLYTFSGEELEQVNNFWFLWKKFPQHLSLSSHLSPWQRKHRNECTSKETNKGKIIMPSGCQFYRADALQPNIVCALPKTGEPCSVRLKPARRPLVHILPSISDTGWGKVSIGY